MSMWAHQAYELIDALSQKSGTKAKESFIRQHADDLSWLLKMTYDPYITYGIKKVPVARQHTDVPIALDDLQPILEKLQRRELTGNAAQEAVRDLLESTNEASAELIARILKKDLRINVNVKTINKAIPDLIRVFGCQLAQPYDEARAVLPCIVQPKLDGVRLIARVNVPNQEVKFFSRAGHEFNTFDHLALPLLNCAIMLKRDEVMFDGEVLTGSFNKTVSEVRRKDEQAKDAIYHIFDVFGDGLGELPYMERLKKLVALNPSPQTVVLNAYVANSYPAILTYYNEFRAKGYEGLIVKDPNAPYELKRSYAWMKIKDIQSVDAPIVDVVEGTGKYVGSLGALVIKHGNISVNVGSGFSDRQRSELWRQQGQLKGRLIEVLYHEQTPDGSLRHPRFNGFRDLFGDGQKV